MSCFDPPIAEMNEEAEVPPSRACDMHFLLDNHDSGKLLVDPPSYLCANESLMPIGWYNASLFLQAKGES